MSVKLVSEVDELVVVAWEGVLEQWLSESPVGEDSVAMDDVLVVVVVVDLLLLEIEGDLGKASSVTNSSLCIGPSAAFTDGASSKDKLVSAGGTLG